MTVSAKNPSSSHQHSSQRVILIELQKVPNRLSKLEKQLAQDMVILTGLKDSENNNIDNKQSCTNNPILTPKASTIHHQSINLVLSAINHAT